MINNLWSAIKHSNLLYILCVYVYCGCIFLPNIHLAYTLVSIIFIGTNVTHRIQNVNNLKIIIIYGFQCLHLIAIQKCCTKIKNFCCLVFLSKSRTECKPYRLYGWFFFKWIFTKYHINWWWSIVFLSCAKLLMIWTWWTMEMYCCFECWTNERTNIRTIHCTQIIAFSV